MSTRAASSPDGQGQDPAPLLALAGLALLLPEVQTGLDKLPLPRRQVCGSLGVPAFGLGQGGPPQEGAFVPAGALPVLQAMAQALAPEEKLPVGVEPALEPGPVLDQGLVGHFHRLLARGLVPAGDHQAGVRQFFDQLPGLLPHLRRSRPGAGCPR